MSSQTEQTTISQTDFPTLSQASRMQVPQQTLEELEYQTATWQSGVDQERQAPRKRQKRGQTYFVGATSWQPGKAGATSRFDQQSYQHSTPQEGKDLSMALCCTKVCKHVLRESPEAEYGVCRRQFCTYAHSMAELRPSPCKYGSDCRYPQDCFFCHPEESATEFYQRTGRDVPDLPATSEKTRQVAEISSSRLQDAAQAWPETSSSGQRRKWARDQPTHPIGVVVCPLHQTTTGVFPPLEPEDQPTCTLEVACGFPLHQQASAFPPDLLATHEPTAEPQVAWEPAPQVPALPQAAIPVVSVTRESVHGVVDMLISCGMQKFTLDFTQ